MRRVRIDCQSGERHPFVAIDTGSNDVIFRHDNLAELLTLCRKMRWEILPTPLKRES
jgi:hypothetical protein